MHSIGAACVLAKKGTRQWELALPSILCCLKAGVTIRECMKAGHSVHAELGLNEIFIQC